MENPDEPLVLAIIEETVRILAICSDHRSVQAASLLVNNNPESVRYVSICISYQLVDPAFVGFPKRFIVWDSAYSISFLH
jgi:hypothetical protein